MKLPAFEYVAPETLAEVIALLAADGDAKPIAGGQSLIPVLAFRLAQPSLLVDLRKLRDLDHITVSAEGVSLGAKVRWRDIEVDARLSQAHPLLVAAVSHIAHYQVRNRGTVGGSLAHADVAAELPGIAMTCDAEIIAAGPSGRRAIKAADFFLGPLTTALAPGELIVELRLPPWQPRRRWAFEEFARQRGAFAIAGIALFYDEKGGVVRDAHIGVIGASSRLHRLAAAEAAVNGHALDEAAIVAAGRAAAAEIDAPNDLEASADYRRALVGTLVERALARAAGNARQA
jgi:aerobic carbon-monoxide dehydrogenase medium subunit